MQIEGKGMGEFRRCEELTELRADVSDSGDS